MTKREGPTKDLTERVTQIQGRLRKARSEALRAKYDRLERSAAKYPQTAEWLRTIYHHFESAELIGFQEAGREWGTWDVWSKGLPVCVDAWTPPKGRGRGSGYPTQRGTDRKPDYD